MNTSIFVIGGCRSGKSSHAMKLSKDIAKEKRVYVATCVPYDDEMKDRVNRHQKDRDATWRTVEEPLDLPEIIREESLASNVILVDCLTLWVTNLLMQGVNEEYIFKRVADLTDAISKSACPVILVSNEVGTGIVPDNPLARKFRDIAGFANQNIARHVGKVVWMVAGIPVDIKDRLGKA